MSETPQTREQKIETRAFERGAQARAQGLRITRNPLLPRYGAAWTFWRKGWRQAGRDLDPVVLSLAAARRARTRAAKKQAERSDR